MNSAVGILPALGAAGGAVWFVDWTVEEAIVEEAAGCCWVEVDVAGVEDEVAEVELSLEDFEDLNTLSIFFICCCSHNWITETEAGKKRL